MENAVLNQSNKKPQYFAVLDFVRFIAALLIVSIHIFPEGSTTGSIGFDTSIPTLLGVSFAYSLVRAAVPVFFFVSSFLLFKRIELDKENKWKYIGSFLLRLLFLYLFWYIVGLPITIRDISSFISQGDTYNLIRYIVNTLWKGAPRGYWFLVSLGLCALITSCFNSRKSLLILFIVSCICYAYGCFNSAYFGVFELTDNPVSRALLFVGNYLDLYMSSFVAFIFVVLGKIFALHGSFKIKGNLVLIIVSFVLMVGELFLTQYFKLFKYSDAFFSLPIFVFLLMNKLLPLKTENESFIAKVQKLKKVGSFSYLFHIQFFYYMHWILDSLNSNIFRDYIYLLVIPYLVCIVVSFGLQTLFEYLSKYKFLRFLKYSY